MTLSLTPNGVYTEVSCKNRAGRKTCPDYLSGTILADCRQTAGYFNTFSRILLVVLPPVDWT